jgi:uncharacterized membrane protein YecN with MAPEG domain
MEHAALIILLALIQYVIFTLRVGANRAKYHVDAPKTEGNETWERLFRVQQNTLEQLIIFIPAMWFFSLYLSELWALVPGLMFIVGRQLYAHEYVGDPRSRVPGMALTLLANAVLMIGAVAGVLIKIF